MNTPTQDQLLNAAIMLDGAHPAVAAWLVRMAEQQATEPVAWMVMNGVCDYQLFWSKNQAEALADEMQKRHDLSGSLAAFHVQPLYTHPAPTQQPLTDGRVIECAARLVAHADFQLGGVLGAHSKPKDIPSNAASKVKARHLAALRDALAAHGITGGDPIPAAQLEAAQALIDHQAEKTWTDPHAADAKIWRQKGGAA